MVERPGLRGLLSVLAAIGGLLVAGCATTDAQNDDTPDIGTSIGTIAGNLIYAVIAGAASALGGYPADYVRSPTYSSGAYSQSYARPARAPSGHRGHRHHH